MNKSEVEKLIDKLADKTLSFGCGVGVDYPGLRDAHGTVGFSYGRYIGEFQGGHSIDTEGLVDVVEEDQIHEILGHPVLIGDVLNRMSGTESLSACKMLLNFWQPCGFDNSLQDIIEDAMWNEHDPEGERRCYSAKELFKFLMRFYG